MSSITSFMFRIFVKEPISFQSFSGLTSCGIFYNLVRSVDESLAEFLHNSKMLAPWSATPFIVESYPPKIVFRQVPAQSISRFSFSIMDDRLCEIFKEAILKPDLHIDLGGVRAKVIEVVVNTYKFSDLASNIDPLSNKFSVKFLTPTAFRKPILDCCIRCPYYTAYRLRVDGDGKIAKPCEYAKLHQGVVIPLPIPALLFRNMARIWSTFSNIQLDVRGVAEWVEDAIAIAGFPKGIKTVRVYEHKEMGKWIIGFMGAVRFSIREGFYDEKYAKIAAALLKMAEITNVGVRRTAGFGMIRYLPSKQYSNRTS
jgi:CRISPR/Cas system endoribonuclease Cas6 (RAMP superfamily)